MGTNKEPKTYRIDKELIKKMKEVGELEKRSQTNLFEKVMGDYCDEYLKKAKKKS